MHLKYLTNIKRYKLKKSHCYISLGELSSPTLFIIIRRDLIKRAGTGLGAGKHPNPCQQVSRCFRTSCSFRSLPFSRVLWASLKIKKRVSLGRASPLPKAEAKLLPPAPFPFGPPRRGGAAQRAGCLGGAKLPHQAKLSGFMGAKLPEAPSGQGV